MPTGGGNGGCVGGNNANCGAGGNGAAGGGKNSNTNGGINTNTTSTSTGAFSRYVTFITIVLNMFLDDAYLVISMFMFSTITRSIPGTRVMFIIFFLDPNMLNYDHVSDNCRQRH